MRRDTGPPPVGRQIRTVMAKVNQSHLLLATVFLVLGTVVHDASTATVNKDLEAFIQKSSRMIAAPFPSKSGAPGNDDTTTTTAAPETTSEKLPTTTAPETTSEKLPTTTAPETTSEKLPTTTAPETTSEKLPTTTAPETTSEKLPTTTAPETTSEKLPTTTAPETTSEKLPTTTAPETTSEKLSTTTAPETTSEKLSTTTAPETTSEKLPTTTASDTTGKISTTTAAPQTTTEALPSDDIWMEIEKELNEITVTLNELKEFVDNVTATTTTEAPEPTTTSAVPTSTTKAPEPTTTSAVPTSTTKAPEPTTTLAVPVEVEGQEKQPLKTRQMIPPLYFLSKIDLGIFKGEAKICKIDDPADLCERLTSVLNNVEANDNKIPDLDEATMNDLNIVRGNTTELKDVSKSMHENPSFVTVNLDVEVFNSRVETVNKTIQAAIDDIDDKLSDDNTLAIVLGTIFGILGVALIIGAIVMYRKKNKRKQGTSINMERNVNPSSRHSSQSGE